MTATMQIVHPHVVIDAPAESVFAYLADLRNMPDWSIHFCKGIRFEGGDAYVQSPQGEVYFGTRADARTGVVDWLVGPTKETAACWPTRVVPLPAGGSLFTVTALLGDCDDPGVVERLFADELGVLKRNVERGAAA
jgi:hypothetical protein